MYMHITFRRLSKFSNTIFAQLITKMENRFSLLVQSVQEDWREKEKWPTLTKQSLSGTVWRCQGYLLVLGNLLLPKLKMQFWLLYDPDIGSLTVPMITTMNTSLETPSENFMLRALSKDQTFLFKLNFGIVITDLSMWKLIWTQRWKIYKPITLTPLWFTGPWLVRVPGKTWLWGPMESIRRIILKVSTFKFHSPKFDFYQNSPPFCKQNPF